MFIADYLCTQLNKNSLSDKKSIKDKFDQVADHLLRHCRISIDEREYHLAEIEFYYHSEDHPDPYVHQHPNQSKTGLWYFHEVGQDLTFGSDGSHGGILIRVLKSVKGGKYIDGPIKTFDGLFNQELSIDQVHCFNLKLYNESALPNDNYIYSFPRVGMYPRGREYDEEYFFKAYRYMSYPWHSKAERHVIFLYLKYFLHGESIIDKLEIDKSMIREYEKGFSQGKSMSQEELNDLFTGRLKMNVNNKCRLLGWYYNKEL